MKESLISVQTSPQLLPHLPTTPFCLVRQSSVCILDNVGQESSVNDLLYNWLEKERRKDKKKIQMTHCHCQNGTMTLIYLLEIF